MSVDLNDLVEPLRIETQAPGGEPYPDATDDDYVGNLTNAFWELRLYGFLQGYEENAAARGGPPEFIAAIVTPTGGEFSPTQDLSRDMQQLIILWAAWKIALNHMGSLNTLFRAKAGPVEYETQQAASVVKDVLDQLQARIKYILDRLPSIYGGGTPVAFLDAVIDRTYSQATGWSWWLR
jgi:hypothetical protein